VGYVLADRIARRDLPMSHAMKTTLVFMAFWADDDGRNTRPAAATLGDALIHDQRTVEHTTAELVADGWLKDDKPRFVGHAKNRRIDVELVDSYPVIDHDELRRIETFVELVRYAVKLVERAKSEGSEANFEAARAAVRAAQEAREDRRGARKDRRDARKDRRDATRHSQDTVKTRGCAQARVDLTAEKRRGRSRAVADRQGPRG
jgi:hypothetical protein